MTVIPQSCIVVWRGASSNFGFTWVILIYIAATIEIYYWNKVTVHHLKLCYFLMKKDNTMICGVLLNHCLTVNRIISKSVCLDSRLRDTSLKRCGVKSQFTNSVSCVSIIALMQAWQRRRMRRRRRRMRRRSLCMNHIVFILQIIVYVPLQ